jgi:CO/xanthine dehydrogenase FAD-binding subunit
VSLLQRHRRSVWALAGGLDSFDWLKDRNKRPSVIIDLSGIEPLRGIKALPDGGVEIGATTTLTEIANNAVIKEKFKLLADAAGLVASPQIRNQGTLGGTCRRTRAAGTTAAAGPAIARAATSAMPIRPRRSTASTRCSTPIAASR